MAFGDFGLSNNNIEKYKTGIDQNNSPKLLNLLFSNIFHKNCQSNANTSLIFPDDFPLKRNLHGLCCYVLLENTESEAKNELKKELWATPKVLRLSDDA